jgi:hypothetical protein
MAYCRGRSGPLEDVLQAARGLGLDPSFCELRDIDEFARRLDSEYRVAREAAVHTVAAEIESLAGRAVERESSAPAERARLESEYSASMERIAAEVAVRQVLVDAARVVAREELTVEVQGLEVALDGQDPGDAADRARVRAEAFAELDSVRRRLREAERQLGLLRLVFGWLPRWTADRRIRRCRARRRSELAAIDRRQIGRRERLEQIRGHFDAEVEKRMNPSQASLDEYRITASSAARVCWDEGLRRIDEEIRDVARRLDALRANADREVEVRVTAERKRLDAMQAILKSKEMVGARAEVRVAEELRRLPDDFHVLHHLRLKAQRFLRCDGVPVQSAEVDHLVVGPTGIYLLETKCWGRRFVEGGDYFNPFAQVRRAGLLCHVLLNDAGLPAQVRELVVPFGDLPNRTDGSRARVVPPGRLLGCIRRGRSDIDPRAVPAIAGYLWDNFGIAAQRA